MYNDRQEWIIRVGCLFIVVGVHLWLLLFSQVDFLLSGQSTLSNLSDKSRNNEFHKSISSSLSLSFSSSPSTLSSKQYESSSDLLPEHKPESLSKKTIQEKIIKETRQEKKVIKPKSTYRKVENKKNTVSQNTSKKVVAKKTIARKTAAPSMEKIVNESVNEISEKNKVIAKQESQASTNQEIQQTKEVIIYKPQLAAPPIPPKYPNIARRKKQQGTVWLDISLDKKGKQQELYVYKSSGVPILDKAAITAVKQWQFAQFQRNYHAQQVKIRIPIEFSLN